MADQKAALPPIIVIKKKKGHGGHHGGAWKVAYADFVTAMMALFIVLWLMNASPEVKKAVGGYFKDPSGKGLLAGSSVAGSGEQLSLKKQDMSHLKEKLEDAVRQMTNFKTMKNQVTMTVTGEGLRVELMETDSGMFFQSGSPMPTPILKGLLATLSVEVAKLPNRILLEGHTDSKPFGDNVNYSNWELSTDRANSARRLMEADGLKPGQVAQVRGFADQALRKKDAPDDPSNRRISLIIQYLPPVVKEAEISAGKPDSGKIAAATAKTKP